MTSSASSAVRTLLAGYLDGRVPADRLIPALAAEYYRTGDQRTRDALRPVMDVIERAAPGVGQLARTAGGAGFDIRLAERMFPASDEAELRRAVSSTLGAWGGGGGAGGGGKAAVRATPAGEGSPEGQRAPEAPGFLTRIFQAVRRLFSASP
jgi:hypothetical protein